MESIIQVFPDEYHLDTMKSFLKATAALHTTVNAKSIVIALVDRLSNYALTEKTKLEGKDGDLFTVFTEQLRKIFEIFEKFAFMCLGHQMVKIIKVKLLKEEKVWNSKMFYQWRLV